MSRKNSKRQNKKQNKKNQVSKKIFLTTLSASMLLSGVAPIGTFFNVQSVHAAELQNVAQPTNVLVSQNVGDSITAQWDRNGSPEGTEYLAVATPVNAQTNTTTHLQNLNGSSFPAEMNFRVNNWYVSQPYFGGTTSYVSSYRQPLGENKIEFTTDIPDTATSAYFSLNVTTRTQDTIYIYIDGILKYSLTGYSSTAAPSFALTPGQHDIKIVYKNTGNTSYMGEGYVDNLQVRYYEKEHVDSGWITDNTYTFANLDQNRDYNITVKAKNGTERTSFVQSTATTELNPTNVENGTQVNWNYKLEGASSYELYRNNELVYSGTETSFNDTAVLGTQKYFYKVLVKDANGNVIGSSFEDITIPAYVQIASEEDNTGATLTWSYDKVGADVGSFELLRDGVTVYTGSNLSFHDSDALGASNYQYTLKAKDSNGNLLETKQLAVAMPLNDPADVVITNNGSTTKSVQWSTNHNNEDTEYIAIAKPVGATRQQVQFNHNLNGQSFPAEMNLRVRNWYISQPYFGGTTSYVSSYRQARGQNTIEFTTDIPATATSGSFSLNVTTRTQDSIDIFIDGVRKYSLTGYSSTASPSFSLTPGQHDIKIVYNNTGNTSYMGEGYVDNLRVSYYYDGSAESAWVKNANSHTFENLDPTKEYEITVRARNGALQSNLLTAEEATRFTAVNENNNVALDFEYLLNGEDTYEVLKDGEVIYTGSETSFVDTDTLGETEYTYTVNVKDANGTVIGSSTKEITTNNYTSLTATPSTSNVSLSWDYEKEGASSYTVLRNNEEVYSGTDKTFRDTNALGATNYTYVVQTKDADGNVIGSKSQAIQTPIHTPSNFKVVTNENGEMVATWDENGNPTNTQYLVQAAPVGVEVLENYSLSENFEDGSYTFGLSGNWYRNTAAKYSGSYGLRSGYIGHYGSTTGTITVDVPEGATNPKFRMNYRVSSESGYDWLNIYVNGSRVVRESGSGSWKTLERLLKPGKNTIQVQYTKDGSVSRYSDAAFIDNLVVSYESSQVKSSGWVDATSHTFTGLEPNTEYEVTLVAKANGLQSQPISNQNDGLQQATTSVENLSTEIAGLDLTSSQNIANAQTMLDEVSDLVAELPEGAEKDALVERLAQMQEQVTTAQNVFVATESVSELETTVSELDLTTQAGIDEAKVELASAQELVDVLPTIGEKADLQERIDAIQEEITLAQNVFTATASVVEVEELVSVPLETQESIDNAQTELNEAQEDVNVLPEGNESRVALQESINESQGKLDVAQATFDVKTVESNLTQESINDALVSIQKLLEGEVKTQLEERVEISQNIVTSTETLATISSTNLATFEEVGETITTVEEVEAVIATIPETSTVNAKLESDRKELVQKVEETKWYVAEELISVIDQKYRGNQKSTLTNAQIDLLVEYAIHDSGSSEKSFLKNYLQPLLGKFVTGKQINDAIDRVAKN